MLEHLSVGGLRPVDERIFLGGGGVTATIAIRIPTDEKISGVTCLETVENGCHEGNHGNIKQDATEDIGDPTLLNGTISQVLGEFQIFGLKI